MLQRSRHFDWKLACVSQWHQECCESNAPYFCGQNAPKKSKERCTVLKSVIEEKPNIDYSSLLELFSSDPSTAFNSEVSLTASGHSDLEDKSNRVQICGVSIDGVQKEKIGNQNEKLREIYEGKDIPSGISKCGLVSCILPFQLNPKFYSQIPQKQEKQKKQYFWDCESPYSCRMGQLVGSDIKLLRKSC